TEIRPRGPMIKTFVVLTIAALCPAVGDGFRSSGMPQSRPVSATAPGRTFEHLTVVVRHYRVTLGVVCMGCCFSLYPASPSWADLSVAKPITSLSFVFSAVLAALILGEDLSWKRWVGTLLIVGGVLLVGFESSEKPAAPHASVQA